MYTRLKIIDGFYHSTESVNYIHKALIRHQWLLLLLLTVSITLYEIHLFLPLIFTECPVYTEQGIQTMGNLEWSNRHSSWSHEVSSLMESHTQSTQQLGGVTWRRKEPGSLEWGSELPSRGRSRAGIWHGGTNQWRQGAVSRGKACLGPMPVNTGQSWQPGKAVWWWWYTGWHRESDELECPTLAGVPVHFQGRECLVEGPEAAWDGDPCEGTFLRESPKGTEEGREAWSETWPYGCGLWARMVLELLILSEEGGFSPLHQTKIAVRSPWGQAYNLLCLPRPGNTLGQGNAADVALTAGS